MDTDMPAKEKKLPFKRRVQDVVADLLGTKSPLRVPDSTVLPSNIDKRKNADVEKFYVERKAMWHYAVCHALKQSAEANYKKSLEALAEVLNLGGEPPGTEVIYTRGDLAILVKVANPQHRVDRDMLRNVLMTDCKFSADRANEIILKSEKEGKAPTSIIPTVSE